jgi:2-methylcitrate dehydratase PrpD
LDAAADLMATHSLTHDQVAKVEIRTFHNATRLAGHTPASPDEFAYSIAFPVATMIVRGQVGVSELDTATLTDPDILRLSKATTLIDDDHFTAISVGKRWAEVTLGLTDGRRLTADPRTPRGDTDLPLSDADISDKFHLFADPVVGTERATRIEDLSGRFDTLDADSFAELMSLCLSETKVR